jgi:hypothetical protein
MEPAPDGLPDAGLAGLSATTARRRTGPIDYGAVPPGLDRADTAGPGTEFTGRSAPADAVPLAVPVPVAGRRRPDDEPDEEEPAGRLTRRERVAIRRASTVRARATVRHLDVLTVLRVAAVFFLFFLIIVVVASVLLVYAASAFGTLPAMEKSIRTLFDLKTFKIHPTVVAEYTSAGAAIIAVAGIFASLLGALIYNLIAEVVGGIRVEIDSYPD